MARPSPAKFRMICLCKNQVGGGKQHSITCVSFFDPNIAPRRLARHREPHHIVLRLGETGNHLKSEYLASPHCYDVWRLQFPPIPRVATNDHPEISIVFRRWIAHHIVSIPLDGLCDSRRPPTAAAYRQYLPDFPQLMIQPDSAIPLEYSNFSPILFNERNGTNNFSLTATKRYTTLHSSN